MKDTKCKFKTLHRAKMKHTSFFVYGFYTGCNFFIVENEQGVCEIEEDTLGVYINKECSETKEKLFTGDLVKLVIDTGKDFVYLITYDDFNSRFALKSSPSGSGITKLESCIKVGNIFENPELFKAPEWHKEPPSKTRTSESFGIRNQNYVLKSMGIK